MRSATKDEIRQIIREELARSEAVAKPCRYFENFREDNSFSFRGTLDADELARSIIRGFRSELRRLINNIL